MKSLIQTHQEPVIVKHFTTELNEYKQMHKVYTERTAYMYLTKYNQQQNGDDIPYNDIVLIGITHDNDITDQDNILYNGKEYKVRYTIMAVGSVHWNQVFLALVK